MVIRKAGKGKSTFEKQRSRGRRRTSGGGSGAPVWIGIGLGAVLLIGAGIWWLQCGPEETTGGNPTLKASRGNASTGSQPTTGVPGTVQPAAATIPSTTMAAPVLAVAESSKATEDANAAEEIHGLFDKYRKAAIGCRGEEAVTYVDQNTIQYFQTMLDLARTGSSAEVKRQTFINRMMILICRLDYSPQELLKMTGRQLFVSGVDRGKTGKDGMQNLEPGKVTVEGDQALVQFRSVKDESTVTMVYRREEGQWKMDFTSMMKAVDMAMKAVIQKQGMDENEFLFSVLESLKGERPEESIWEPVVREN